MLLELRIESLLVIERAELRFGEGLNAITGETGAGKTVLAHSLDLLMGGRARPQIVRPGADEAYVEGVFAIPPGLLEDPGLAELAERLPEDAEELVLARRVGTSGRTSAFIQGRSATAADLQAVGARLLAFYGQHEHRKLTLASAQLEVLDGFIGAEQLERRREHAALHGEATSLQREVDELREREGVRERDLDLLRFELAEIEAATPDAAEEDELMVERERLRHAEDLRQAAAVAAAAAAGDDEAAGAAGLLAGAEAALDGVAGVDADLDAIAERVRGVTVELADATSGLRSYLDGLEADPGRLEQVEERLAAFEHLKRKHGGTIEAVLEHADSCRERVERLANSAELAEAAENRLAAVAAERADVAAALSEARRKGAKRLAKEVESELEQLAMDGASLEITVEPHPDGFASTGADRIEFMVATNAGMPASPLRDAASGGELSRVMLALTGLAAGAGSPTLVFDEIDAGVGGKTARAVGARLKRLGAEAQVVCITHLPQVASQASAHFRITKSSKAGETRADVERVDGEELVAEIVRMLGSERDDEAADRHARELLAAA